MVLVDGVKLVRLLPTLLLGSVLALTSVSASAYDLEDALRDLNDQYQDRDRGRPDFSVSQNKGGKSLSEAVEQVRRKTNGRILSAETRVKGNREVHHIKVLTEDGKVKTHKVQGRRRGN
jgi:uncharacterized membrane protein YkoI